MRDVSTAYKSTALAGLSLALPTDWATTLGLVFGGCCSNAITLERVTSEFPNSGALLTFAQFLLISLHGLPKFLTSVRGPLGLPLPWLKQRRIPLTPYLVQVALFYAISLLNNAAFAYDIPMPVHIIFRSGGLVISLLMGWVISGRTYSLPQVISVLLVTSGVVLTTFSASNPRKSSSLASDASLHRYVTGIALLTLALVLSGFLGIVQDKTYSHYGNTTSSASPPAASTKLDPAQPQPKEKDDRPDTWEESMFYLHFLSLPMFLFVRRDIAAQLDALLSGPTLALALPPILSPLLGVGNPAAPSAPTLTLPALLVPLVLNTVTQLFCVAGVNRLTTRVAALTVTLTLVVRKAVSLVLSVALFRQDAQNAGGTAWGMLWSGAALVFLGTVGYSMGGRIRKSGGNGGRDGPRKDKKD